MTIERREVFFEDTTRHTGYAHLLDDLRLRVSRIMGKGCAVERLL